jgi:hypothetical protein
MRTVIMAPARHRGAVRFRCRQDFVVPPYIPQMTDIADHDTPWKEALEHHFPEFLSLLFPQVHAGIDWSKDHHFLDKELQKVVREANSGRRYADKLVRVYAADGKETWLLIHIEVQGEPEADFAERMYRYNYRLFDRYSIEIISLAVLADASERYRPQSYQRQRWGCQLTFQFPIAKLLDSMM